MPLEARRIRPPKAPLRRFARPNLEASFGNGERVACIGGCNPAEVSRIIRGADDGRVRPVPRQRTIELTSSATIHAAIRDLQPCARVGARARPGGREGATRTLSARVSAVVRLERPRGARRARRVAPQREGRRRADDVAVGRANGRRVPGTARLAGGGVARRGDEPRAAAAGAVGKRDRCRRQSPGTCNFRCDGARDVQVQQAADLLFIARQVRQNSADGGEASGRGEKYDNFVETVSDESSRL
mmetsp:Transcript_35729/g.88888  ORF Transcript_35729/g.88888 Transcript_35729/m.88888 type:complete len:244 (-) Transcript_35729:1053-1784(-)